MLLFAPRLCVKILYRPLSGLFGNRLVYFAWGNRTFPDFHAKRVEKHENVQDNDCFNWNTGMCVYVVQTNLYLNWRPIHGTVSHNESWVIFDLDRTNEHSQRTSLSDVRVQRRLIYIRFATCNTTRIVFFLFFCSLPRC